MSLMPPGSWFVQLLLNAEWEGTYNLGHLKDEKYMLAFLQPIRNHIPVQIRNLTSQIDVTRDIFVVGELWVIIFAYQMLANTRSACK